MQGGFALWQIISRERMKATTGSTAFVQPDKNFEQLA